MRSKILLAGVAGSIVVTGLGVIGAVLTWWWLVVLAGMSLLSAALLVSMDANRKTRYLRNQLRSEAARIRQEAAAPQATSVAQIPPPISELDVVGAVKVLQAQYVGRLDRLQDSVDSAVDALREARALSD